MQFTPEEEESVAVFVSRRRKQIAIQVLLMIFVASGLFGGKIADFFEVSKVEVLITLMISIVILLTISFFIWRCPRCNKFLGLEPYLKECKRCGMVFPPLKGIKKG